ncbi:MAG: hypothetical protein M3R57_05990, partial [Chloroflexota bacterium]|nr:hypothetical protein [Chloroflexota bacterium]
LYLVAMALFVVTITIGILNGADVVEFDRNQLLTHVHSGTIGWMTLTIVASSFLLFRAADRRLMLTLSVLVPIYVLAFYTGSFPFRAVGGIALLAAIGWLLVWLWRQFLAGERSLPRLAVVLGLTTFGWGAVIGVLLQVQFALGRQILTGNGIGAHASAMTFGYLVLVAMGLIEWRLLGTRGLPRAGLVQVMALFAGGLIISIGLLAGAVQAAGGVYLLTQLIAVVLFVVRIWPTSLRTPWLDAGPIRHIGAASLWIVGALVLFMYIIFTFIQNPTDPNALPLNVLIASDHSVYIGVITNIVLGLLVALVAGAGSAAAGAARRAWIGHVTFWGVNLGLAVFVIGLIVNTAELKRIGAPVMGVALLVALAIVASRAVSASLESAEADLA